MIYYCVYCAVYEKDVFKNVAKRKKIKNINKLTIYAFCVFILNWDDNTWYFCVRYIIDDKLEL